MQQLRIPADPADQASRFGKQSGSDVVIDLYTHTTPFVNCWFRLTTLI